MRRKTQVVAKHCVVVAQVSSVAATSAPGVVGNAKVAQIVLANDVIIGVIIDLLHFLH